MTHYEQVLVKCSDNETEVRADVLHITAKSLKVVIANTTLTLNLNRVDPKKPYVTNQVGLEFTSDGNIL